MRRSSKEISGEIDEEFDLPQAKISKVSGNDRQDVNLPLSPPLEASPYDLVPRMEMLKIGGKVNTILERVESLYEIAMKSSVQKPLEQKEKDVDPSHAPHQLSFKPADLLKDEKLVLIVDLDQTLIVSEFTANKSYPFLGGFQYLVERYEPSRLFSAVDGDHTFSFLARCGVQEFIETLRSKYHVVIYSAGAAGYVRSILKSLDLQDLPFFSTSGPRHLKSLKAILGRETLLQQVLVVDDSPEAYVSHSRGTLLKVPAMFEPDFVLHKLTEFLIRFHAEVFACVKERPFDSWTAVEMIQLVPNN
jgi:hypothetical protein